MPQPNKLQADTSTLAGESLVMSKADILAELPELSPAERQKVRLKLARLDGEEWRDAEKALFDVRLAAYEKDPDAGSSWEEVGSPHSRPVQRTSRRLIVRPEAEADIIEAALWYDEREAGLGLELTLKIRAAMRRVLENPPLRLLLRRRSEVQRVLTRRFPYRIFFIVRKDAIVVFAVIHAARLDRRWRERQPACE